MKDSPHAGFSLANVALETAQDIVSLSRRIRVCGEELGLASRTIRNLSAASYEAARLLSGEPLTKAEIRLSDGPSLQVVFRVPHGEAPLAALHARLAEAGADSEHGDEVRSLKTGRTSLSARDVHVRAVDSQQGRALTVGPESGLEAEAHAGRLRQLTVSSRGVSRAQ